MTAGRGTVLQEAAAPARSPVPVLVLPWICPLKGSRQTGARRQRAVACQLWLRADEKHNVVKSGLLCGVAKKESKP